MGSEYGQYEICRNDEQELLERLKTFIKARLAKINKVFKCTKILKLIILKF